MSKTNSLTSHVPERNSRPAHKMNTRKPEWLRSSKSSHGSVFIKKFASKKRRQLLNKSLENKI